MKKGTILYLVAAAALYYYWIRRRKATGKTALSAESAASTARQMVADIVDQTTFVADDTTFAKQYAKDQKLCR
jgi:hypothetical protein